MSAEQEIPDTIPRPISEDWQRGWDAHVAHAAYDEGWQAYERHRRAGKSGEAGGETAATDEIREFLADNLVLWLEDNGHAYAAQITRRLRSDLARDRQELGDLRKRFEALRRHADCEGGEWARKMLGTLEEE